MALSFHAFAMNKQYVRKLRTQEGGRIECVDAIDSKNAARSRDFIELLYF
jgi:hypothetical protein